MNGKNSVSADTNKENSSHFGKTHPSNSTAKVLTEKTEKTPDHPRTPKSKRRKASDSSNGKRSAPAQDDSEDGVSGRWTKEEHQRFLEALELYGRDWKKVQAHVGSRTTTQARSHAQKYFAKLEKGEQMGKKEGWSQAATAMSSPVCKPEGENEEKRRGKKATTRQTAKTMAKKTLDYQQAPARKTKLGAKVDETNENHKVQSQVCFQPAVQTDPVGEESFGPMYGCMSQTVIQEQGEDEQMPLYYPPAQPWGQEVDFDFDNFLPEPTKPLELAADFQLPQPAASAQGNQEECVVSIDFSSVLGFGSTQA